MILTKLTSAFQTNYETILQDDALMAQVKTIKQVSQKNFEDFEDLLAHNLCMLSHFTGVQIRN